MAIAFIYIGWIIYKASYINPADFLYIMENNSYAALWKLSRWGFRASGPHGSPHSVLYGTPKQNIYIGAPVRLLYFILLAPMFNFVFIRAWFSSFQNLIFNNIFIEQSDCAFMTIKHLNLLFQNMSCVIYCSWI